MLHYTQTSQPVNSKLLVCEMASEFRSERAILEDTSRQPSLRAAPGSESKEKPKSRLTRRGNTGRGRWES